MFTRNGKRIYEFFESENAGLLIYYACRNKLDDCILIKSSQYIRCIASNEGNDSRPTKKQKTNIPRILDGKFYLIESQENDNISAKCLICNETKKGNIKSTGNFLSHYRTKHSQLANQLEEYLANRNTTSNQNDLIQSTLTTISKEQVKKKLYWNYYKISHASFDYF